MGQKYDNRLDPKAPYVVADVSSPSEQSLVYQVEMYIDSGSSITCVPQTIIDKLGILDRGSIGVQTYESTLVKRETYFINLRFAKLRFNTVEVLSINEEFGLIGLDVLNQVKIILDGPNDEWECI